MTTFYVLGVFDHINKYCAFRLEASAGEPGSDSALEAFIRKSEAYLARQKQPLPNVEFYRLQKNVVLYAKNLQQVVLAHVEADDLATAIKNTLSAKKHLKQVFGELGYINLTHAPSVST